jgi:hypothetical protein
MGNVPTAESSSGPAVKFTDVFSPEKPLLLASVFSFQSCFNGAIAFVPVHLKQAG